MKKQTPHLNAKTVNATLHTGKHTSFSRSRYEIQGHRQPESSGGTILVWGTGEARSKGPTAGGSWRGGRQSLSPLARESGGALYAPPAGSGAEPQPLEGFLAFCATMPQDCLSWHLSILLQLCVELFMPIIIIFIYLICQMAANSKIHNQHKAQ